MIEDYRPMWKDLGLDLEAHEALLTVLGQVTVTFFFHRESS
jgi:hypothetical protein